MGWTCERASVPKGGNGTAGVAESRGIHSGGATTAACRNSGGLAMRGCAPRCPKIGKRRRVGARGAAVFGPTGLGRILASVPGRRRLPEVRRPLVGADLGGGRGSRAHGVMHDGAFLRSRGGRAGRGLFHRGGAGGQREAADNEGEGEEIFHGMRSAEWKAGIDYWSVVVVVVVLFSSTAGATGTAGAVVVVVRLTTTREATMLPPDCV